MGKETQTNKVKIILNFPTNKPLRNVWETENASTFQNRQKQNMHKIFKSRERLKLNKFNNIMIKIG